jgi:chromosome segregation ATPase
MDPYNYKGNSHYDIKYKFFKNEVLLHSNQMNSIETNPNLVKERVKVLENNIEELFLDQKELLLKYEKNEKYWSNKLDDVMNSNKEFKEKIRVLTSKLEDSQSELKETMDRISLRDSELSSLRRAFDDKDNQIFEFTNKINVLRNDLEYSKTEIDRGNKRYNELLRELEEMKKEKNTLKEQISKSDGFYKDIYTKKQDEEKEKLKIITNLESKLFEVSKNLSDKQIEIEKLLDKNNFLQNHIKVMKNEVENELIPLKEKEKEELIKRHKSEMTELENKFKKFNDEKTNEFLIDFKTMEKQFQDINSDVNSKYSESRKEIEKLNKALGDCKELLRDSEINYGNCLNKIKNYEKEIENFRIEKEKLIKNNEDVLEQLKQKIKLFELEVRDQNEIILKNEAVIKNFKKSISGKDDEANNLFEEASKLKNTVSQMQIHVFYLYELD